MEFIVGTFFLMVAGLVPLALTVGGIALIVGAIIKILG